MINLMVKPTEVSSKATRRRFSTAEKIRILREADAAAKETGGVTALLRREGLYSSHLTSWRKQRELDPLPWPQYPPLGMCPREWIKLSGGVAAG